MSKRKRCGAVRHWETLGGMLVSSNGLYRWRCPSCGTTGAVDRVPRTNGAELKCSRLVPIQKGSK